MTLLICSHASPCSRKQVAQFVQAVGLAQGAHARLQLAVLVEQLAILVERGLFVGGADHGQVGLACAVDLAVALVQQVEGVALGFWLTVEQQAVGEGAHTQVQRGEFVEDLDAGHADLLDSHAGLADVAHLYQREDTKAKHQQADQREAQQRARGDIHVA